VRAVASAFEVACLVTVDYGGWLAGPDGSSDAGLCPPAFAEAGCGESHWAAPLHGRSLRSYYRHQRGHDPYQAVGRQDLTADVDFRALALHGQECGFDCLVYTSLARLLCGMGELGAQIPAPAGGLDYSLEDDMEQAPLHALRDEEGLGGLFKIMVQVKEEEPRQE
jgi:SAM-dependent MidA family methyltransferase